MIEDNSYIPKIKNYKGEKMAELSKFTKDGIANYFERVNMAKQRNPYVQKASNNNKSGRDSFIGVLQGLRILLDFLVLLPGVEGQFGVEPAAFVKEFVALFVGALYTLEDADFVDDVLVEAGCAELMVALGHGDHFIKRDLTLAYGAFNSIKFT